MLVKRQGAVSEIGFKLVDTPRFVNYVRKTSERYGVLRPLLRLFDELKIGDVAVEGYRF